MEIQEEFKRAIQVADIEKIKAEYFNENYIIEPSYSTYRLDNKGQRFYMRVYEDGSYLTAPSFSAIMHKVSPIGIWLLEWYKIHGKDETDWMLKMSANYGTFFHILCGKMLRKEKINLNENFLLLDLQVFCEKELIDFQEIYKWMKQNKRSIAKDVYGFVRFCQDYKVVPIAIEYPLMAKYGIYACTLDFVCEMEIEGTTLYSIVDIKSGTKSFYEDNEIQLYAQRLLWKMEHPEIKIECCYNYGCHNFNLPLSKRVTPYRLKDQTDSSNLYKWYNYLRLFHGDEKNLEFDKKTQFKDIEINIESKLDEVFEERDLIDEIIGDKEAF